MPENPFVVHVARLRRVPGSRWHEVRRGPIDPDHLVAPRSTADSAVPDEAEVTCDVVLESFAGGIMVTGTVRAPWEGLCRRCTVPVDGELIVPVRERFAESGTGGLAGSTGDRPPGRPGWAEPEDDEAYPIVDGEVDLRPMARDAVVLELPMAPLCREDCRGLCPGCGVDRNQEGCACVAPRDPRWANLDVLRSAQ
ncbi:MAG TPA: DUF177 domain-containing protein [Acidimicrobiales bacterium]|nr:DUF177 domain-containing protein [Acidimicrobiales bacterium]